MIKAIRADKEYRIAPRVREIIDAGERWGYVPKMPAQTRDKFQVDYSNLEEELKEMGVKIENS